MSQENIEIVEGLLAGTAEMDKQELLAMLPAVIAQTCHPEIEWVEDPQRADGRVYHGHAGVRESFERWLEQWEEYGFEVERIVESGESVLAVARESARGKVSGASVTSRIYAVFTFRESKIVRYQEFYEEQPALAAAGLARQN